MLQPSARALGILAVIALPFTLAPVAAAAAADQAAVLRRIAIAEDQRRWDDVLRQALQHADAGVRARAALAVGRLQDSTTVASLLPLLQDPSTDVRIEATFALGQIGHRSARPALEEKLTDGSSNVVNLAIEALGKLGDKAATRRITPFLGNASAGLRGEAAVALWRLADSSAIGALLEHRSDADAGVRWRVLYALEKVVAPARVVRPVALALGDPDALVRAHAARTLGRQKSILATAYVIQACDDADPAVAVNAIRALQSIADSTSGAVAPAFARALDHIDPYVRVTAAQALGDRFALAAADSADRERVFEGLKRHLRDSDAATRGNCGRALLAQQGVPAYVLAGPLLSDSSVYARVLMLEGFRSMTDAALLARPQLPAEVLATSLEPGMPLLQRMTAAELLGVLGGRTHRPEFHQHLLALRSGVADTSVLFAAACAGALADFGDSASVPLLARAYATRARDADADARISIRDALRTLAGRAFADSLEHATPATRAASGPGALGPGAPESAYPDDFDRPSSVRGVILHTSAGDLELAFDHADATQTVKNFVALATRGYFDGLRVHRVVPDFVLQDGDPTGTGSGGPGWTIRCEYNRLRYDTGMVGMALSGKDTGGSQWFITLAPQPHLNGRYTIFARVTRGLDIARRVVQGERVLRVELVR